MKQSTPAIFLWQKAVSLATRRHRDQVRPDGETPFIAHPVRVALTILTQFQCDDPETIAAALLHDVIEKTDTTYDELADQFGARVATMVATMSKDDRLPAEEAETAYFAQLRAADWKTRLIKLADVYDNLADAGADRAKRREKAESALRLATGDEHSLVLARRLLGDAIRASG